MAVILPIIYGGVVAFQTANSVRSYFGSVSNELSDTNLIIDIASGESSNGFFHANRNSIAHTYTSSLITKQLGPEVAEITGDTNELLINGLGYAWDSFFEQDPVYPSEAEYVDQHNNSIGRQIVGWLEDNNLPLTDENIQDLVIDAYNNGLLINNLGDIRIPDFSINPDAEASPLYNGPISLDWQNAATHTDDVPTFEEHAYPTQPTPTPEAAIDGTDTGTPYVVNAWYKIESTATRGETFDLENPITITHVNGQVTQFDTPVFTSDYQSYVAANQYPGGPEGLGQSWTYTQPDLVTYNPSSIEINGSQTIYTVDTITALNREYVTTEVIVGSGLGPNNAPVQTLSSEYYQPFYTVGNPQLQSEVFGYDYFWVYGAVDIGTAGYTYDANGGTFYAEEEGGVLEGYFADDRIFGDIGDDVFDGFSGDDWIEGREGNDVINGGAGEDRLSGGEGEDIFVFTELSHTTKQYDDRITDFEDGVDRIDLSNLGFYTLEESTGFTVNDTQLRYAYSSAADRTYVLNDQTDFQFFLDGNHMDTLGADDFLLDTAPNQTLMGSSGNDVLAGSTGDDLIISSGGADTLSGGDGEDTFRFDDLSHSQRYGAKDRITDFDVSNDIIDLSSLGFDTFIGEAGSTAASNEIRMAYSSAADRTYMRNDQTDFDFFLDGDYLNTLTSTQLVLHTA